MLAALSLAVALPALAAPPAPQAVTPAPSAAVSDPAQQVEGASVIRGRITSVESGKPLRRAQVHLRAEDDYLGTPRTAATSTDGRYEFRDVPPGRYTLRAQRSGYLTLTYGQHRPDEPPRPLEIGRNEVREKVDFALSRMSVISGRVFDELGDPIAGATVWALQRRYFESRWRLVPVGGNARTDITGQYRLLSLPRGDYVVMASTRETWPLDNDPKQVFGYALSYFPGTAVAARAQPVNVGVGRETADVDLTLVPGRTSTIRGTATSLAGLPLAGATVTMLQEISPATPLGSSTDTARVAGDGSWTFTNVVPGEYRLWIRTPAGADQPSQEAQLTVDVTGADLDGLALVAGTGGTIQGQVVTDDGSPLPEGFDRMQVRPRVTPGALRMMSLPARENGRVRSDGSFELQGVPADSLLSIAPLPGTWTLKAIEVGGRDMADHPLPIRHGTTLSDVRIVLTSRPATVSGVLRDDKHNPADGTVIVFAEDQTKWREGSRAVRVIRPEPGGRFVFTGLPSGDYCLIALASVLDGQWYDPAFLESLKPRAERIAIADAESKHIDLVLRK